MIKVGIIGLGYWGPNLVRNFENNRNCEVVAFCDLDNSLLKKYHNKFPDSKFYNDYKKLLKCSDIDACVIATPVATHFDIALKISSSLAMVCKIFFPVNLPFCLLPIFIVGQLKAHDSLMPEEEFPIHITLKFNL
mgnify:CR=1 FL=1